MLKKAEGKDRFIAKKALIEARKDQYVIKQCRKPPVQSTHSVRSEYDIELPENVYIDEDGNPQAEGVSLLLPSICSIILCNYSKLKQNSWDRFGSDTHYLMMDFDRISAKALKPYPIYEKIVEAKIDGKQNTEIQQILDKEFGVTHSLEYISSL